MRDIGTLCAAWENSAMQPVTARSSQSWIWKQAWFSGLSFSRANNEKKKINVNQSILGIGFILCWIRFRGKLYWEMWRVSGKVMIPALSPSGNSWREYVLNVCLQVSKGNYIHFRELVMYVTTFCWKLCCPKGLLQQAAELSERDLEHKSLTLSEQHTIQAIKFSYKHRERPRLW